MKTLCLPLKKEWYEMIESGVKTEEYREMNTYWAGRLLEVRRDFAGDFQAYEDCIDIMKEDCIDAMERLSAKFKHFDVVRFSYGYTKRTMTFECKGITIGRGKPEWGAPTDRNVFIIKLGNRI